MSEQLLSADPRAGMLSADPNAGAAPPDYPRDARGRPLVSSNASDAPPSDLLQMLGPLAHPQTFTDFARLLGVGVDSVRKAAAGAVALASARPAVGAALSATGRGLKKTGDALDKPLSVGGAVEMFRSPGRGAAALIAPTVARVGGRVLQRAGAFVSGAAPAAAEAAPTLGEAAEAPVSAAPTAAPAQTANGIPIKVLTPAENAAQETLDQAYAKARLGPSGTPTSALPDQKLLNALAIEARRVGVKLTPAMEQTAIEAVGKGASPQQAVRGFAPLAPTAATPAWAPAKLTLTAAESKLAAQLLQDGKTDAEVKTAIETARAFQKRFGTPTPTAAQSRFPKGMRGKTPEGD